MRMFRPLPVAIGLRYLRAKRRNGFISFISLASILGIALGVTVLITTLAVMSGFQKEIRDRLFPNSLLKGRANLFVCPNLDAANIGYNITRVMTDGVALGPILMGVSKPAHILTPAATVRRVVNMTAIAAVEAQIRATQAG